MGKTFDGSETIGEIVSEFPGAGKLFKQARIDFCCGGDRELSVVLREQNLGEEEFIRKLNESREQAENRMNQHTDWRLAPLADLIDYIVEKHHNYLREELPVLSEYVTRILRVHGAAHGELAKLHKLFHYMKAEFEQHVIAEEEILFPKIKQYEENPSAETLEYIQQLDEFKDDHREVGDYLKEMRVLTEDYKLPPDACPTYTTTFEKLEQLESDVFQHVHLENNILFPRISEEEKGA